MLSWFVLNFILIIYNNVSQLTYSYIWIKSVHPSVRKFSWNWLVSFTWNSTCCYVVMGMTKHDFLKIIFCPQNGENKPSLEFFERVGKFSFFSQFFNFFSIWSIMKVCITIIAVCLNSFWEIFIFGKILAPEIWPKMLLANQIAGFLNQSQDSNIGCISRRN